MYYTTATVFQVSFVLCINSNNNNISNDTSTVSLHVFTLFLLLVNDH